MQGRYNNPLTAEDMADLCPDIFKVSVTARNSRRAAYDRLKASLTVPRNESIATPQPVKTKPATGVFASV